MRTSTRAILTGCTLVASLALGGDAGAVLGQGASLPTSPVAERIAYQERMEDQLELLKQELQHLKRHVPDAPSEHLEVEWDAAIRELESQRQVALGLLSQLRSNRGERWLQTREQLEHVFTALEAAYVRTASRIHEAVIARRQETPSCCTAV